MHGCASVRAGEMAHRLSVHWGTRVRQTPKDLRVHAARSGAGWRTYDSAQMARKDKQGGSEKLLHQQPQNKLLWLFVQFFFHRPLDQTRARNKALWTLLMHNCTSHGRPVKSASYGFTIDFTDTCFASYKKTRKAGICIEVVGVRLHSWHKRVLPRVRSRFCTMYPDFPLAWKMHQKTEEHEVNGEDGSSRLKTTLWSSHAFSKRIY